MNGCLCGTDKLLHYIFVLVELALIQRCFDHFNDKTTLGDEELSSDASRYLCVDQLAKEEALIFKSVPSAFVHVSELSEPNTFYNICRLRGAALIEED